MSLELGSCAMEYHELANEEGFGFVDIAMDARFENLKLIGKGSFGDVFRGYVIYYLIALVVFRLRSVECELVCIYMYIYTCWELIFVAVKSPHQFSSVGIIFGTAFFSCPDLCSTT